jgi:hypothetical protein
MDGRNNNLILKIAYKLLHDVLFLLLLVLAGLLVAEALIPGYLSSYLSFVKVIFLIFADLALIAYLHEKIKIDNEQEKQKKPGMFFPIGLSIFILLLLAASLLKFSWSFILIIIFITLAIFYFFYKIQSE